MKCFFMSLLALTLVFSASEVYSQSPAQRNGKTNATVDQLRFTGTNTVKDTITANAATVSSANTQQFDLRGCTSAVLTSIIVNVNGDLTDTIEVNVAFSLDGTTWSDRVPVDSILVTAADADTSLYTVDLLSSAVDATLLSTVGKTFTPLESFPRVRVSYDAIDAHATPAQVFHIFPWLTRLYDSR